MQPVNDTAAYSRGGLGAMQSAALTIGSRTRQQIDDSKPANYQIKVIGPTGKQIASFIICNATGMDEVSRLVREQITFKVTQIAKGE